MYTSEIRMKIDAKLDKLFVDEGLKQLKLVNMAASLLVFGICQVRRGGKSEPNLKPAPLVMV